MELLWNLPLNVSNCGRKMQMSFLFVFHFLLRRLHIHIHIHIQNLCYSAYHGSHLYGV
jgi:hypothetical protein